jgi:hypothetical protein
MARPENPLIALIDDINTTQEITRTNARRLIDEIDQTQKDLLKQARALIDNSAGSELRSKQLAEIIKATERTQRYLKELRALVHKMNRPA